jgi:acyl dehydratase
VPQRLFYEEVEVGQVLESAERAPLTEAEIVAFARKYDPQPFHTDPAAAADTFFGRLVASGWHTAALTMALMVEAMPFEGGLVGAGIDRLLWPRPVLPGDRLRVRCQVMSKRVSNSRPNQGLLKVQVTTLNQRDEPVQLATPNMLLPRREA